MKGQTAAVGLVMACGLAMMIMARSLTYSLESMRDEYYQTNRFADVFADLKRAPNDLRAQLSAISGVAAVDTRATGKATLDLPGMTDPADCQVVSLPDDRPQQLNLLFLRTGRLPEPRRAVILAMLRDRYANLKLGALQIDRIALLRQPDATSRFTIIGHETLAKL